MGGNYINLTNIYITNILGIILIFTLALGNAWKSKGLTEDRQIVVKMLIITLSCCIIDPLVYTIDGHPGKIAWAVIFLGNSWMYVANTFCTYYWVHFMFLHTQGKTPKIHSLILKGVVIVGFILSIINYFVPIAFSINENNVYKREFFFWIFFAIDMGMIVDSLIIYFIARKKGGYLKMFPIHIYILPLFCGIVVQAVWYGISIAWTCVAISIAGVLTSIQNETICIDNLTGVYNRAYFDYIRNNLKGGKELSLYGIMLDLNGFKKINDNYGHAEGDVALQVAATLLKTAVGSYGSVIRYAGDEFIVLLNVNSEAKAVEFMGKIRTATENYNSTGIKPYAIAMAMGCCKFDLKNGSLESFMNEIDKKMYEDKEEYYKKMGR